MTNRGSKLYETDTIRSGIVLNENNNEYGYMRSLILDIPVMNNMTKDRQGLHPTQKPVALFEYLIKTYTNEGETVLDNCMGSGTTAVACINTGRNYIGMEKDKGYFDIAVKRAEVAKALKEQQLFKDVV